MRKLSTGQDSTLRTYKELATIFGAKAVNFIQSKIDDSPNGENEEVIVDETQMIQLLSSIMYE